MGDDQHDGMQPQSDRCREHRAKRLVGEMQPPRRDVGGLEPPEMGEPVRPGRTTSHLAWTVDREDGQAQIDRSRRFLEMVARRGLCSRTADACLEFVQCELDDQMQRVRR